MTINIQIFNSVLNIILLIIQRKGKKIEIFWGIMHIF